MKQLAIGIIGIGMVGTPLKRWFEEGRGLRRGEDLFLFDIDPKKDYRDDINRADIIFLSVPTPRSTSGAADLSALDAAFRTIEGEKTVVIKSTVPPGTTEKFQKRYPHHRVLFNPEFLTEAHAWEDTIHPDRQLVGWTSASKSIAESVLSLLPPAPLKSPSPALSLSASEAEIVKYAANVFLTRKVTFANAIFDLASYHEANYDAIRAGLAADPRIGPSHLDVHHGGYRGYGGYCFVKDTDALIAHCREVGLEGPADLFDADRAFNTALLAKQKLTPEDVSVHDSEWIQKKLNQENK